MFGTGTRFAEYGITGGFFLFFHVLVICFFAPAEVLHQVEAVGLWCTELVSKMPAVAQPAFQSLLVALGLLSVFVTGLLLDLIGSIFMLAEARMFRVQTMKNAAWLGDVVGRQFPDYADDYRSFRLLALALKTPMGSIPNIRRFWTAIRAPRRSSQTWRFVYHRSEERRVGKECR